MEGEWAPTSSAAPPKGEPAVPWQQKWGNAAQIVAALAATATCCAAIYGLTVFSPVYRNALLTEENARLRVEQSSIAAQLEEGRHELAALDRAAKEFRTGAWNFACEQISARMQMVVKASEPFKVEPTDRTGTWYDLLLIQRDLTESALLPKYERVDFSGLTRIVAEELRPHLEAFHQDYFRGHNKELLADLMLNGSSTASSRRRERRFNESLLRINERR